MKRSIVIVALVLFAGLYWAYSSDKVSTDGRLSMVKVKSTTGIELLKTKISPRMMGDDLPIVPARPMVPSDNKIDKAAKMRVDRSFNKMPLRFEKNDGQTSDEVKFLSRGQGYTMYFTATESVMALTREIRTANAGNASMGDMESRRTQTSVVRMEVVGANPNAKIEGEDQLPGTSNYFVGNDKSKWRQAVPNYRKVRYTEVYPGIDLVYYGNQRKLEYDFVVKPGANPQQIALKFDGPENISINSGGELVLQTKTGQIVQRSPYIYQTIDGKKKQVQGSYQLQGQDRVSFKVAQYDMKHDLVIDPVLAFSTYLGSTGEDEGRDIAVDGEGNVYVTGFTKAGDFDTLNEIETFDAVDDVIIFKLEQRGNIPTLAFSTYLGGSDRDVANAITLDDDSNIYLTGFTHSTDFNVLNEIEGHTGSRDVFVVKLEQTNNVPSIAFSTYLGGGDVDTPHDITVGSSGSIYLAGETYSSNFDVLNEIEGDSDLVDIFVTKLEQTSNVPSLAFSTYLGGEGQDRATSIALDDSGNVYITGSSCSDDFDLLNEIEGRTPHDPRGSCFVTDDVIVTKFEQTNNAPSLAFSTFLGGEVHDRGFGIALDDSGNIYVVGETDSTGFDLLNEIEGNSGRRDIIVFKLEQSGNVPSLAFSTYLGGMDSDFGEDIVVDDDSNVFVSGHTTSIDFDLLNEIEGNSGGRDAILFQLEQTGNIPSLVFSTYLGGARPDRANALALDDNGFMYITGQSFSADFDILNEIEAVTSTSACTSLTCVASGDVIVAKVLPQAPGPVARNDFDGDGSSDLFTINQVTNDVDATLLLDSVPQVNGTLFTNEPVAGWVVQASGDFNADGTADVLLINTVTGEIVIARVDGTSLIDGDTVLSFDPTSGLAPRGLGDFEGDGKAEIVLHNPTTGELSLIFLNGLNATSVEPVGMVDVANNWTLRETGDFNNDGKTDFFIYNFSTGAMSVLEMDGATITAISGLFVLDPATGFTPKDVGDFDGDGDTDILVTRPDGTMVVLPQETGVVTAPYALGTLPAGWELINVGQYDTGDRLADLLINDTTTGDIITILQDGTAATAVNTVVSLGPNPDIIFHRGTP